MAVTVKYGDSVYLYEGAGAFTVTEGHLHVANNATGTVAIYAPGRWDSVEKEEAKPTARPRTEPLGA
jgi:hypothetical protein